jgi:hypothetical protein
MTTATRQELVERQERAYSAAERARLRLETLDWARWHGNTSISRDALESALAEWRARRLELAAVRRKLAEHHSEGRNEKI